MSLYSKRLYIFNKFDLMWVLLSMHFYNLTDLSSHFLCLTLFQLQNLQPRVNWNTPFFADSWFIWKITFNLPLIPFHSISRSSREKKAKNPKLCREKKTKFLRFTWNFVIQQEEDGGEFKECSRIRCLHGCSSSKQLRLIRRRWPSQANRYNYFKFFLLFLLSPTRLL